jgi:hypothetical protein
MISVFKLIPAHECEGLDSRKFIGGFKIRSAPASAVARIIETMAGRFSIGVQILLVPFSEIGDASLSFFFPAYGNYGNLICDNLRAARDLRSREQ